MNTTLAKSTVLEERQHKITILTLQKKLCLTFDFLVYKRGICIVILLFEIFMLIFYPVTELLDIVETYEFDTVANFAYDTECTQDIQRIVDSSLNVFEINLRHH